MTVHSLGNAESDTIMGGIVYMLTNGMWPLALVIFVASFCVPLGKLVILTGLLLSVHRRSRWRPVDRTRLYRITVAVGRWSMVDIFVVTILVALVHLGALATIEAELGAVFFGAVVVLTMLAAESFDPRLIWDRSEARSDMTDGTPDRRNLDAPEAVISTRRRISIVWLIPLVAAAGGRLRGVAHLLGAGPGDHDHLRHGRRARGRQDQGQVQGRGDRAGRGGPPRSPTSPVSSCRARMVKDAEKYLTEGTRFWVVKARVAGGQVTGLGTLLSGAYIGIDPVREGKRARAFQGLEVPPVVTTDAARQAVRAALLPGRRAGRRHAGLLPQDPRRRGRRLGARPDARTS